MGLLNDIIRSQDAYGQPVALTLKGEGTYKSVFGGIVTILGRLALLYYVISSLVKLSKYESNYERHAWSNDVVIDPNDVIISEQTF